KLYACLIFDYVHSFAFHYPSKPLDPHSSPTRSVMVKVSLLIFTVFVLIYVKNVNTICPVNFTDVGAGVCMIITKLSANYCAAHAYCETLGIATGLRLFIPSRNAARLLQIMPNSSYIYTGHTRLLIRRTSGEPDFASELIAVCTGTKFGTKSFVLLCNIMTISIIHFHISRCSQRSVCRSFYYHLESRRCLLSLYVDSLMPDNYSTLGGTWWRFGRPYW
ncbi:hypothetical protein FGIG_06658, partial [Fasciola gigantica]